MLRRPNTEVLKIRDYRNFIIGKFLLTFCTRTLAVIVSWLIYEKTKSEWSLGLIGLAEALPFLVTALFAGVVADRIPRKKIIMVCVTGYFTCCIALLIAYIKLETYFPVWGVLPIYLIVFATGVVRGFYAPAHGAFAAQLVTREMYVYSSVWNSLSFEISSVTGPAVAGLVYGFFGPLPAIILLIVFASLALISFSLIKPRKLPEKIIIQNVFRSIKEGLTFVFKTQQLVGAFAIDMFAVFFGGAIALLPAFADKILHCGPQGLGFLQAAPAIGAIVMSVFLSGNPIRKNAGKKMLFAVAMFGLCILGFALSTNYYLAFFFLMLSGVFDEVSVVVRSVIVQLYAPEDKRGRVEAVSKIFIGSSNEIGAFESGLAARYLGLVPSVVFGSFVTLIIAGLSYKYFDKIRNLHL